MPTYIKRPLDVVAPSYRGNDYDIKRLEEVAQERCGLCWDLYPASMMIPNDGTRRCPDCFADPDAARTAEIRAWDAAYVAARKMRSQVSEAKLQETAIPFIREMQNASGVKVWQGATLGLVRSGSAVSLVIIGGGLASSDAFSYSTGISDSIAPSLSGTTQWTLTLVASGATTPGLNHMTFNNHTYRNIFSVG